LTLGQHGILLQEFVRKIHGVAVYRNRLVHGYADFTPEEIYDLLTLHLMDFSEFTQLIFSFVEQSQTGGDPSHR